MPSGRFCWVMPMALWCCWWSCFVAYKLEQKERKSNAEQRRRERGAEGEGGSMADDVMDDDEDDSATAAVQLLESNSAVATVADGDVIAVQTVTE